MKEVVYLAGQISVCNKATYEWRRNINSFFSNNDNIEIIDPCSNQFNKELLHENKDKDNLDWSSVLNKVNNNILVPKDKSYVNRASVVIANLIHYDPNKPIIGTLFELAWCNYLNDKTVIGIKLEKDCILYTHPFINSTITTWVTNEYDACKLISYYFV